MDRTIVSWTERRGCLCEVTKLHVAPKSQASPSTEVQHLLIQKEIQQWRVNSDCGLIVIPASVILLCKVSKTVLLQAPLCLLFQRTLLRKFMKYVLSLEQQHTSLWYVLEMNSGLGDNSYMCKAQGLIPSILSSLQEMTGIALVAWIYY